MYLLTAEGKGGQREHRSTVTVFYQMIACHVPGTVCFAASQNFCARVTPVSHEEIEHVFHCHPLW